MAVYYMNSVNIPEYDPNITNKAWEYEDSLGEVDVGEWIVIPNNIKVVPTQLVFSDTATAKMQYTCSPLADVLADTATANDSVAGAVSVDVYEKLDPVRAVRLNVTAWTSGTVKLQVMAQ